MAKTPTPEEIASARQMVAEADAAAAAERKASVIATLTPFTDAGLGAAPEGGGGVAALIAVLRTNYTNLAEIDPSLPNLAFSTAQALQTLDDRIRSLATMNAPAAAQP